MELIQSEYKIKVNQLEEDITKQSSKQQTMVYHYEQMLQKSTNEISHLKSEKDKLIQVNYGLN